MAASEGPHFGGLLGNNSKFFNHSECVAIGQAGATPPFQCEYISEYMNLVSALSLAQMQHILGGFSQDDGRWDVTCDIMDIGRQFEFG